MPRPFALALFFALGILPGLSALAETPPCARGGSAVECRAQVQLAHEALLGNRPKSTKFFREACLEGGDNFACARMAAWLAGHAVADELSPAEFLPAARRTALEADCEKKDGYSCAGASLAYANGIGVTKSFEQSFAFEKKACEAGNALGCAWASISLLDPVSDLYNAKQSVEFAERACREGDPVGCSQLAFALLSTDGGASVRPRVLSLFAAACERGAGAGCNGAGWMDENGYATGVSLARARSLFERGCELDYGHACKNLGGYAERSEDYARAAALYRKACDLGFGEGCFEAAFLPDESNSPAQAAQERRLALFREGCDRGHGESCLQVAAIVHVTKPRTAENHAEARSFVKEALAPGNVQIIQKLPEKE